MTSSCTLGPSYLDVFVDTMSPYLSRHLITRNQIYLNYHRVETLHCSFGGNVNYHSLSVAIIKVVGCSVRLLCTSKVVAAYSFVEC